MTYEDLNKIILEYDQKNGFALRKYLKWIDKNVELGNKIPARVIKKLISFFKTEKEIEKAKNDLIRKIITNTLKRFPKYNFESEEVKLNKPFNFSNPQPIIHNPYSLSHMLQSVLEKAIDNNGKDIYNDKTEFIGKTYLLMSEYQEKRHVPEKELKDYKKHVLSAFLAIQIGYVVVKKEKPSNHDLFANSRHAVGKFAKKK